MKLILVIALSLFISTPAWSSDPWRTPAHTKVEDIFKSGAEKTAKDALWTASDIFKVAVFDDGSSRNGYAEYVCTVLFNNGFKGKKIWVQVVDMAKIVQQVGFIKIGEARCK